MNPPKSVSLYQHPLAVAVRRCCSSHQFTPLRNSLQQIFVCTRLLLWLHSTPGRHEAWRRLGQHLQTGVPPPQLLLPGQPDGTGLVPIQDLLGCAKTPAESLLLAAPGRQPLRQQPLRDAAGAVDPEAEPGAEGVPGEARRRVRRARRLLRRVRRHPRPLRGAAPARLSVKDTADGTCSRSSLCWFTKCRFVSVEA